MKKRGPRTEPCGTPTTIVFHDDIRLPLLVL